MATNTVLDFKTLESLSRRTPEPSLPGRYVFRPARQPTRNTLGDI